MTRERALQIEKKIKDWEKGDPHRRFFGLACAMGCGANLVTKLGVSQEDLSEFYNCYYGRLNSCVGELCEEISSPQNVQVCS